MDNFFYAVAVFADGHKETFEGRLQMLGGIPDEEGRGLLLSLKQKERVGEIISLSISYES